MAISRADRRRDKEARARDLFGVDAEAALDLLELTELAWHNCFGDVSPPDQVVTDMLDLSAGTVAGLARAARLAVADSRDLRVAADQLHRAR